jgi:hypothetical protein
MKRFLALFLTILFLAAAGSFAFAATVALGATIGEVTPGIALAIAAVLLAERFYRWVCRWLGIE